MPTDDGVGFHHEDGEAPVTPEAGQEHPESAVPLLELRSLSSSLQHLHLVTQSEVLEDEGLACLESSDERSQYRIEHVCP
jgi:hypothetical protein